MVNKNQLMAFRLDAQGYALYLSVVEKVVRAAEITPLPKAPEIVLGIVNWQGRVIPVVNMRARFGLTAREIDLADRFIFARTGKRVVALIADSVDGVIFRSREEVVSPEHIAPGITYIDGVAKLEDGLLLIHDLDKFLSLEEKNALDCALKSAPKSYHEP
jgi:purine-binding chemotaxis protein CheW